ncbi:MAG: hypothetical protein A3K19_29135 [Lentisphaerae bacterium RIFOXYB12_FULL_65_16]|nr:MAG: hypothetical protein A3K18_04525 [Lentisphaerae bacterium RIFOXYA12_64_32]OGV88363.1 MAG: hypothetical protein A3K19_29135 [Lentisphaerae bacterium RIFOXYB12_FULL_65_16]
MPDQTAPPAELTPHVLSTLETFARPAVESGLITRADLRTALRRLRQPLAGPVHGEQPTGLLRRREAATFLGCSGKTIVRMVNDGALHPVYLRPGLAKSVRYAAAELANLAKARA